MALGKIFFLSSKVVFHNSESERAEDGIVHTRNDSQTVGSHYLDAGGVLMICLSILSMQ